MQYSYSLGGRQEQGIQNINFSRRSNDTYRVIGQHQKRQNKRQQTQYIEKDKTDWKTISIFLIVLVVGLSGVILYQNFFQKITSYYTPDVNYIDYQENVNQYRRKQQSYQDDHQQNRQPQPSPSKQKIQYPAKSIFDSTFINLSQQYQITKLLSPLNLQQSFTIKFNQKNPDQHIYSLNRAILKQPNYFIIFILTSNQHIFGVYMNRNQKSQSFIFSLDSKTISKIAKSKIQFLLEVDQTYKRGPKFGKVDLTLFNSKEYDNCMTHFCYSFECPGGLSYGSEGAKSYLAGKEKFHVDQIFILGSKV